MARNTANPGLLIPIGLLAGFCYASKYTAFLAVPYAFIFIAWKLLREHQAVIKPLLLFSACVMLMMVPWMAKNWIMLDNPFSPFFNSIFPNPYTHQSFEAGYSAQMRNYHGLESHWDIPLEVTVHGETLVGLIGPLFLLIPLALLSLRQPAWEETPSGGTGFRHYLRGQYRHSLSHPSSSLPLSGACLGGDPISWRCHCHGITAWHPILALCSQHVLRSVLLETGRDGMESSFANRVRG